MGYGKKSKFKKPSSCGVRIPVANPVTKVEMLTRAQAKAALNAQFNRLIDNTMAVCVDILHNDFGKLQKKNTRLKEFWSLFMTRLSELDDNVVTTTQQAAYDEFKRQTGVGV